PSSTPQHQPTQPAARRTIPATFDVPDLRDHRGPVEISPRELPHHCAHQPLGGHGDLFHPVYDVPDDYPQARLLSVVVPHEQVHASPARSAAAAGVLREALADVPDAAILVGGHQPWDCMGDESAQLIFILDRDHSDMVTAAVERVPSPTDAEVDAARAMLSAAEPTGNTVTRWELVAGTLHAALTDALNGRRDSDDVRAARALFKAMAR
ncbi:hypothetical protein, partial [Frankia tisae]|uniref:hypothetical protein n=1 Tax=Frankia tisae TaxID=2950104 RepID=UPI0021BFF50B